MTFNLNKIWLEDGLILKERNEWIATLTAIVQSFNLTWLDCNTTLVQGTQQQQRSHENSFSSILIPLRTQPT